MSILTKLTVGAVAVLGAYALGGKRRETGASSEDKKTSKRSAQPKATSKANGGHSAGRTAKRAAAKARPRKRPQRSTSAKRAHAT